MKSHFGYGFCKRKDDKPESIYCQSLENISSTALHSQKQLKKFNIEIFSKMILTGNYTCSRGINEESHLCLAKYTVRATHSLYYKHFAKHGCNFSSTRFPLTGNVDKRA